METFRRRRQQGDQTGFFEKIGQNEAQPVNTGLIPWKKVSKNYLVMYS
jgi:hypothetical protein